jgi:hypothetical protein
VNDCGCKLRKERKYHDARRGAAQGWPSNLEGNLCKAAERRENAVILFIGSPKENASRALRISNAAGL